VHSLQPSVGALSPRWRPTSNRSVRPRASVEEDIGTRAQNSEEASVPTLYRGGNRAEIVWTEDDIAIFIKAVQKEVHIADGLRLAALTGLRRQDLVTLTWANMEKFALVKKALKSSRRKRRYATIPRMPELDALLKELCSRYRQPGVEMVLVNSYGRPWTGDGFGGSSIASAI
jgi:integrase